MQDHPIPSAAEDEAPAPPPEEAGAASAAAFLADVLDGLARPRKAIPGKYLWDETGSRLFDRICGNPDYYPTEREVRLLRGAAPEVAALVGPEACLIEFGSGAGRKARALLDALDRPRRYVGIDISGAFLDAACARLAQDYPALAVTALCADYARPLTLPPRAPGETALGYFPGTSVGNMAVPDLAALLERVRAALEPGWLLVGADPNQDPMSLSRAYADRDGLMAAFHGNLLDRIARELGGDLSSRDFRHEARILPDPPRVEAHLVARRAGAYRVGGRVIAFAEGESIRTDSSHKYAPETFRSLAAQAGWEPVRCWSDPDGLFNLHLLRA